MTLTQEKTIIPDELKRHVDPEGGYDDPEEVGYSITAGHES